MGSLDDISGRSSLERPLRAAALALSLLLIFTLPWRGAFQFGEIGSIGRLVCAVVAVV